MARKPRLFAPGVLYHVIVWGNQRQKTFLKELRFIAVPPPAVSGKNYYRFTAHNRLAGLKAEAWGSKAEAWGQIFTFDIGLGSYVLGE
jgi:hypothetical protein